MMALKSETLRGRRRERVGGGRKILEEKRYFLKESLCLKNEMFGHVFLYHQEKGKRVMCRQIRSV